MRLRLRQWDPNREERERVQGFEADGVGVDDARGYKGHAEP